MQIRRGITVGNNNKSCYQKKWRSKKWNSIKREWNVKVSEDTQKCGLNDKENGKEATGEHANRRSSRQKGGGAGAGAENSSSLLLLLLRVELFWWGCRAEMRVFRGHKNWQWLVSQSSRRKQFVVRRHHARTQCAHRSHCKWWNAATRSLPAIPFCKKKV